MGKSKKTWQYMNSASQRCGTMVCTECRCMIEGDYRTYNTDDGYRSQCRKCAEKDPKAVIAWQKILEAAKKRVTNLEEYQAACKEFAKKWDVAVLDEEIEDNDDTLKRWKRDLEEMT